MTRPRGDILPSLSQSSRNSVDILHGSGESNRGLELEDLSRHRRHRSTDSTHNDLPQDSRHLLGGNSSEEEEEDGPSTTSMNTRTGRAKKKAAPQGLNLARGDTSPPNGSANSHGRDSMNGNVELRRKNASIDSHDVTANLMSRESFSLDDEVPRTPTLNSNGFFQLPKKDQRNFTLLVILYFLQGIPMGLAMGSVPFLLKPKMSYSALGVFSLASYPYSMKLFWSPIVDAVWSPRLGRRKSWIMPVQLTSGLGMIYLGSRVQGLMETASKDDGAGIWGFTGWWFFLVFMCATQDIAVDGWALTLLSAGNISYASTAQTVGLTAGHFMSYTVFLAFNSPEFANKYFRHEDLKEGVMTLGGYLTFWGWAYIAVTIGLATLKKEERTKNEDGIWDVYKVMWRVLKLKNIQTVLIIHLIAKIGFQVNDGVTNLKLIDKGFSQEDLALTVLIDFPFEIFLGYYVGKWSATYTPMRLWCWGFVGRLVAALLAQATVIIFPTTGVTTPYLLVVIAEHIFSTFTSTTMFVAISAFHARISDPVIGGTYMTLLATFSNLGGTFPRFFVLKLVDAFTVATCIPPTNPLKLSTTTITTPFSCAANQDRARCLKGGGLCDISTDGYYVMNIICVLVGALTFWAYIKPAALRLQALPLRAWRTSEPGSGGSSSIH